MKISKNTKVFVSLEEIGTTLLRMGKYASKNINGKTIVETISEPVIGKATKSMTLGYEFVAGALNLDKDGKSQRPRKPHPKAPKKEWDQWKGWTKLSNKEKVRIELMKLAHDYNCELISFEIIE